MNALTAEVNVVAVDSMAIVLEASHGKSLDKSHDET